jgi:exodeoxyribonuclease V alpha subunit
MNHQANQPITLKGAVERITFSNPENGYTVARFQVDGRFGLVTVVGPLAEVHPGARLKLFGRWKTHPKYGKQFEIERYVEQVPATVQGIKRYLGSGLVKGIGPVMAKRIAEKFGTYTLEVIEKDIGRLVEVEGIGPKRVRMIAKAWQSQKQIKEIMLFLQSHQVSTTLAVKIYKSYGDRAISVVKNEPYRLAQDIFGIGFLTADKIARTIGIEADAPQRIAAGLEYTLNQLADQGHVFAPREHLVQAAVKILAVRPEQVEAQIETLRQEDRIKIESLVIADPAERPQLSASSSPSTPQPPTPDPQSPIPNSQSLPSAPQSLIPNLQSPVSNSQSPIPNPPLEAVYLPPFYYAEVGVARRIRKMQAAKTSLLAPFAGVDWEKAFAWLSTVQKEGIVLAEGQRQAAQMALSHKVTILTGGPGTGKTSTVRAILDLVRAKGKEVLLAAPTGRAAKRLAESTGHEAKTIHRLLEVSPSEGFRFQRNQDNPLACDLLILDECSMVDVVLMNSLLKAVHPTSHLLLVGDADQLPSVGAGNVLRDLIDSKVVPVTQLEVIFRQAADSTIITNAHRINRGDVPVFLKHKQDFFFFGCTDPDRAAALIVDIVARRIPTKFGIPADEIQVLSPMHRGVTGVRSLNEKLQARLNSLKYDQPEYRSGSRLLRVGDRVMQLRNNYDKDVFNGDMGRISTIDLENGELQVKIEDRLVTYEFSDLDEITLAYAASVHKSQGSEYPVVVMPVLTQHYVMLQRNLLYTAITRAKKMVVLVGTHKAMAIAVKNNKIADRWSALQTRLRSENSEQ